MNIFVLDRDPAIAASMMCNKHICKMILESGQMLCTAHWLAYLDGESSRPVLDDFKRVKDAQAWLRDYVAEENQPPWKMSHVRHPCTQWVMASMSNYVWLLEHMRGLLDEYTKRYKKKHKSEAVYSWLSKTFPVNAYKVDFPMTPHPLCVPEEIKSFTEDPVQAYRTYSVTHKSRIAKWKPHAEPPEWWPKEDKNAES